ncbi:MAG: Calx-beta domain-containing protein [Pyrinomonadaceae bacterium]
MPHPLARRTAVAALVSLLALSVAVIAAAAGAPGTISFISGNFEVEEGDTNAVITLRRSGGSDGVVTAKVTLTGGTATGGLDYRLPSPGALDPSFNVGAGPRSIVRTVYAQPDGKSLIGGVFFSYFGFPRDGLARLNANGSLDTTFVPAIDRGDVYCIALQPDGKVLVGGYLAHNAPGTNRTGIARLNANGSFDTTFVPGTGAGDAGVRTLALLPDGKILIGGGFTSYDGVAVEKLARLNPDGTLDASFNPGAGPGSGYITKLLAQPDGKILAGGWFSQFAGQPRSGVARMHADGGFDPTFNAGSDFDIINVEALALLPDGDLLAGGGFHNGAPIGNRTPLARLNADGSTETSYTDPGYGHFYNITALVAQPDGKFIVGGWYRQNQSSTVALHFIDRRNPDGTDDTTFNTGVRGFGNSHVWGIALQPDGKVIVGGQFSKTDPFDINNYDYVARIEGDMFVTWGAGDSADKTVRLPVFQDSNVEDNETVELKLEALTGGATAEPAANATLTILDNDSQVGFPGDAYSVSESAGTINIPVERVGSSQVRTTITYAVQFGTAGSGDFTHTPAPVTIAPGETNRNITIAINDDAIYERDETFTVEIATVTGGVISRRSTVVTILNDDPLPSVSVGDITIVEGDSGTRQAVFTVTREGLTDRTVTVNVRTVDGTAVAGEDYVSLASQFQTQLQIGPGVGSNTLAVSVYGDTIIEGKKSFSVELSSPVNATIARAQAVCEIEDNDTSTGVPTVQLGAREVRAQEGAGVATLTVTRSGDSSAPASVNYATTLWPGVPTSGFAWDRNDYTFASGTLRFAAGETSKELRIFIADDALVEGDEVFTVTLSGATGGASLGGPAAANVRILDNDTSASAPNPLDDTAFFVRQHYRDFLGRDPDAPGLQFWTNEIDQCGSDAQCREVKRVNVSAAFFLSIEFQETGYFVYLLNKASFDVGERLPFGNYAFDGQQVGRDVVVGADGWELKLAANKQELADAFVARSGFLTTYPQGLTAAQFVDALNANTGDPLNPASGGSLTQAERDRLVADLASGAKTRAQVLRAVAEHEEFRRRQLSKAFVLMQYFGYLRRAPNALPDNSFDGYNFWLSKLDEFGGNYINAEMVKAFIASDEYRKRFGQ